MADTRANANLTPEIWDDRFFAEYLTENRYTGEIGTDENSIIQLKEDLTKKKGDRVNFALVNKLTQDAITGRGTMEGNEEDMATRSFEQAVDKRRNAVRVAEIDEQYSAVSLREAGKFVLKDWAMKDTEKLLDYALGSINGVNYSAATETQKDDWLTDNRDRVLFGSGYTGNDHSAGLAELSQGTATEWLTTAHIDTMKLNASSRANPKIRPVRVAENGRYYYVMYAHPLAFRDLKKDTTLTNAQKDVKLEMENSRIFQGGDLLWNGVIIKEAQGLYDTMTLTGAGESGTTTVVPAFLCGAQALAIAYARRWRSKTEEFDYGDKFGVETSAIYGVGKIVFGTGTGDRDDLKDNGLVTGYFASSTVA